MAELPQKLIQKLEQRRSEDALRYLPHAMGLVDFSSNDYLGFAQNEQITQAALKLLRKYGGVNGSTGSRLLTGNHTLYGQLEQQLTEFHKAQSALVFNSGYDANIGFFSSVPQRGDVVFYDELIHASIRDGLQLGQTKSYKFGHNNLEDLEKKIQLFKAKSEGHQSEIYVVTESVFSMDGDTPDLKNLSKICTLNNARLVIDEAHAVGIFGDGCGLVNQLGLEKEIFARIITFGKALGCHGAAILGNNSLKEYLINFARSLIYTTAMPSHSVATIIASYMYLQKFGDNYKMKLQQNIKHFKEQIVNFGLVETFISSDSAIHCATVPGNRKVKAIAFQLQKEGFNVKPILSPTVKKGTERLRFCLHAYNVEEEMTKVLSLLKNLIG